MYTPYTCISSSTSRFLLVLCLIVITCSVSEAQSLAGWPFSASTAPSSTSQAANTSSPNAVTVNNAVGAIGNVNTSSGYLESDNWPVTLDINKYFEFQVVPAANYNITVTGFSMILSSSSTTQGPKDYAIRTSADNFVSTIATGTGITNATQAFSGVVTSIQRIAATVTVRLYLYNAGQTSRFGRVSSFKLLGTVQRPTLTLSPVSLSGFSTTQGVPSATQSYVVSGTNLVGDATLTAPSGYEISTSQSTGFGSTLTLPNTSGTVTNTPIYVRLTGVTQGAFSGNVSNASTDAISLNVALSGSVLAPLPVELVSFQGRPIANTVQLNWATAWERFADRFVVQRSKDAAEFIEVGTLPATGTANGQRTYTLVDEQPADGTNYYRLKQIDQNGSVNYSKTIAVTVRADQPSVQVYPNPSDGRQFQLQVRNLITPTATIQTLTGQTLQGRWLKLTDTEATWQPDTALAPGIYLLSVRDGAVSQAVKVLVQ
ncbi:MAG: T9SS type A sorting domain-containing protein [Cytophagaceae bacterium]|nr:MAG: T9SS type A sorting domain-containing protein [Cytophagaceae bacterium]